MSLSISANLSLGPSFDALDQASQPPAKPTSTQQLQTLAASGESATQIAAALGLPKTLVNVELGIETPSITEIPKGFSVYA